MKFNWKKIWQGFKLAIGIGSKLHEEGVIKVKELPKVEVIIESVDEVLKSDKAGKVVEAGKEVAEAIDAVKKVTDDK